MQILGKHSPGDAAINSVLSLVFLFKMTSREEIASLMNLEGWTSDVEKRLLWDLWNDVEEYLLYFPTVSVISLTFKTYVGSTGLARDVRNFAYAIRIVVNYSNLCSRAYRYTYTYHIQAGVNANGALTPLVYFDLFHRVIHEPVAFGTPASRYRRYYSTPLREELEQ